MMMLLLYQIIKLQKPFRLPNLPAIILLLRFLNMNSNLLTSVAST